MENMEVFKCAHNTQSMLEAPSIFFVFYADVVYKQFLPQYYHTASENTTVRCFQTTYISGNLIKRFTNLT